MPLHVSRLCVCVCVCVCVCRHGGTPNLSRHVRAIPQSQCVPSWYRPRFVRSLPYSIWTELTPHGQRTCREIVAEAGADLRASYFSFLDEDVGSGEGQEEGQQGQQQQEENSRIPKPKL